jgi:hypothetical protein
MMRYTFLKERMHPLRGPRENGEAAGMVVELARGLGCIAKSLQVKNKRDQHRASDSSFGM